MTVQQLADTIGMSQSQLSKVENGSIWIGREYLISLSAALKVSIPELFAEDGIVSTEATLAIHSPVTSKRLPIWDYKTAVLFVNPSTGEMHLDAPLPDNQRYVSIDHTPTEGSFFLIVSDGAMEPRIAQGAEVLVDVERDPQPGSVIAILYREGQQDFVSLRTYHQKPNGFFDAVPENRTYATYDSEMPPGVRIIGVVSQSRQSF